MTNLPSYPRHWPDGLRRFMNYRSLVPRNAMLMFALLGADMAYLSSGTALFAYVAETLILIWVCAWTFGITRFIGHMRPQSFGALRPYRGLLILDSAIAAATGGNFLWRLVEGPRAGSFPVGFALTLCGLVLVLVSSWLGAAIVAEAPPDGDTQEVEAEPAFAVAAPSEAGPDRRRG